MHKCINMTFNESWYDSSLKFHKKNKGFGSEVVTANADATGWTEKLLQQIIKKTDFCLLLRKPSRHELSTLENKVEIHHLQHLLLTENITAKRLR